jgi:hypothetical protein
MATAPIEIRRRALNFICASVDLTDVRGQTTSCAERAAGIMPIEMQE